MNVQLSDIGNVNLAGHMETAGFGGLEQSCSVKEEWMIIISTISPQF